MRHFPGIRRLADSRAISMVREVKVCTQPHVMGIRLGYSSPVTSSGEVGVTSSPARTIKVNRAPVLTLWAAVVTDHLGFERPGRSSRR